jgi:glycerophosphoryl diester phosphodiesterase
MIYHAGGFNKFLENIFILYFIGDDSMVINYAHRGASGYYPENTMLSFEKALGMGCTGIETDVHMTKDGVLILMHDEMVNRTTDGTGFIKDYTYSEIKKLDAGSWMSEEFKNVRVPSAEELLLLVREKDVVVNIEIKSGIIIYDNIEEKLIELIHNYNMEDRVIFSSFNHYSMVKCKEIDKNIKTGLLYGEGLYKPEKYARYVGADALHPNFYALNREIISGIKEEGILINTYTVNDVNYMKYFLDMKVEGIITNYPDKLKKIMDENNM